MKTKLDHIYGSRAITTDLQNLETKVTNLSNIAAKTNIANTFSANQNVNGVITMTGTPTENNHVATKGYVDSKVVGWTQLQNWTGNFKTTSLEWTNTLLSGELEFNILVANGGVKYSLTFSIQTNAANEKFTSPVAFFHYGSTQNSQSIVANATNGFYVHYNGTKINIIKVGNTQPETNTNVIIRYRKVG